MLYSHFLFEASKILVASKILFSSPTPLSWEGCCAVMSQAHLYFLLLFPSFASWASVTICKMGRGILNFTRPFWWWSEKWLRQAPRVCLAHHRLSASTAWSPCYRIRAIPEVSLFCLHWTFLSVRKLEVLFIYYASPLISFVTSSLVSSVTFIIVIIPESYKTWKRISLVYTNDAKSLH